MLITQKKHRLLREVIDNIQSLVCDLKIRGVCLGHYNDCQSNALYLIAHKLEESGKNSSEYIFEIIVPPYNYGMPERHILKIKWNHIDDFFKEASHFTLDRLKIKFANILFSNND